MNNTHGLFAKLVTTVAWVIVAVAVAVASLYLIEYWRGKATWDAYASRAKSQKKPLSLAEMRPLPVADEENVYAAPIFRSTRDAGSADGPFRFPGKRPPFPSWDKPSDFEKWRVYVSEQAGRTLDPETPIAAAVLAFIDERFGADWNELVAAVQRPKCQSEEVWVKGTLATSKPAMVLMNAQQLNSLRAYCHVTLRDSAAAAGDIRTGIAITSALPHQPTLIEYLVNATLQMNLLQSIRHGISAGVFDQEQMHEFQRSLKRVRLLDRYVAALETERAVVNDIYQQLRRDRRKAVDEIVRPSLPFTQFTGDAPVILARLFPTGWLYASQLRTNSAIDKLVSRIDTSAGTLKPGLEQQMKEEPPRSKFESLKYLLHHLAYPAYSHVERRALLAQNSVNCGIVACALERHRLRTGTVPRELAELVPTEIETLPIDVIDGQALRYRVSESTDYVIYSIGLDGRDDGGATDPSKSERDQRDWTWRSGSSK